MPYRAGQRQMRCRMAVGGAWAADGRLSDINAAAWFRRATKGQSQRSILSIVLLANTTDDTLAIQVSTVPGQQHSTALHSGDVRDMQALSEAQRWAERCTPWRPCRTVIASRLYWQLRYRWVSWCRAMQSEMPPYLLPSWAAALV